MMTNGHIWACPHSFRGCTYPGLFPFPWNPCLADREEWVKLQALEELLKPTMKKPTTATTKADKVERWVDAEFERDWPYLAAFLKDTQWDDGSLRETGTMLLFVQEGYLKCCLNDRAMNRSAFVTAVSIDCLFDLVEAGLETDKLEWRQRR